MDHGKKISYASCGISEVIVSNEILVPNENISNSISNIHVTTNSTNITKDVQFVNQSPVLQSPVQASTAANISNFNTSK